MCFQVYKADVCVSECVCDVCVCLCACVCVFCVRLYVCFVCVHVCESTERKLCVSSYARLTFVAAFNNWDFQGPQVECFTV